MYLSVTIVRLVLPKGPFEGALSRGVQPITWAIILCSCWFAARAVWLTGRLL
jgi:hypothetical protein